MKQVTKANKYKVKKQVFFNWYFKNQSKEQISAFLSPYLLNIAKKDAKFSINDLLKAADSIPSTLIEGEWLGTPNALIKYTKIQLIK
jgi:hypothetical protein